LLDLLVKEPDPEPFRLGAVEKEHSINLTVLVNPFASASLTLRPASPHPYRRTEPTIMLMPATIVKTASQLFGSTRTLAYLQYAMRRVPERLPMELSEVQLQNLRPLSPYPMP
jgi:hypothetical protein